MRVERFMTGAQARRALRPVAQGTDPGELLDEAVIAGLIEWRGRLTEPLYHYEDVREVRDRLRALAEARGAEEEHPPTAY